jgi:lambda repressor-like predicted transcriptional regulator
MRPPAVPVARILALKEQGLGFAAIAERVGLRPYTVSTALRRAEAAKDAPQPAGKAAKAREP